MRLLLAQPEYARQSPYGYCRCKEPVNYVRSIRSRYNAYLDSAGEATLTTALLARRRTPVSP